MLVVPETERRAMEELRMNAVKSKSAWMALLAAGGLYAWNNRDKIQSWINAQRGQLNSQSSGSLPATGATRASRNQQDVPSRAIRVGSTTDDSGRVRRVPELRQARGYPSGLRSIMDRNSRTLGSVVFEIG